MSSERRIQLLAEAQNFQPSSYDIRFRLSALTHGRWSPMWKHPEDDMWQALWRSSISEFFATMIFVFIGCGSVIAMQAHSRSPRPPALSADELQQATLGRSTIEIPSLTLISLAHGFCIMVMVYTVGEISGGSRPLLDLLSKHSIGFVATCRV